MCTPGSHFSNEWNKYLSHQISSFWCRNRFDRDPNLPFRSRKRSVCVFYRINSNSSTRDSRGKGVSQGFPYRFWRVVLVVFEMDSSVTFLGPRIHPEIRKLLPLFQKIEQKKVEQILIFVLEYIKGSEVVFSLEREESNREKITEEAFESFAKQLELDVGILSTIFTGLFYLLRIAIRSRTKIEILQKGHSLLLIFWGFLDLADLKFPEYLIVAIIKLFKQKYSFFHIPFHIVFFA